MKIFDTFFKRDVFNASFSLLVFYILISLIKGITFADSFVIAVLGMLYGLKLYFNFMTPQESKIVNKDLQELQEQADRLKLVREIENYKVDMEKLNAIKANVAIQKTKNIVF